MTAETDLLPLPDVKCWRAMKDRNGNVGYSDKPDPKYSESAGTDGLTWVRLDDHRAAMQAYARACVSSATEALRAEVAEWKEAYQRAADSCLEHAGRADRLAEAGRRVTAAFRAHGKSDWMDRNSTRDECEAAMLA